VSPCAHLPTILEGVGGTAYGDVQVKLENRDQTVAWVDCVLASSCDELVDNY
jgi:hypothetical protein